MAEKKEIPKSLREFIESQIEPTEPFDLLRTFLESNNGKRLDKRLIDKLNDIIPHREFRIANTAGMTLLQFGGYGRHQDDRQGGSILMSHQTKNVYVDVAYMLEHNTCYYSARDARNATRRKLLAGTSAISKTEGLIRNFLAVRAALKEALANDLFAPDRTLIESSFDIDDHRR